MLSKCVNLVLTFQFFKFVTVMTFVTMVTLVTTDMLMNGPPRLLGNHVSLVSSWILLLGACYPLNIELVPILRGSGTHTERYKGLIPLSPCSQTC